VKPDGDEPSQISTVTNYLSSKIPKSGPRLLLLWFLCRTLARLWSYDAHNRSIYLGGIGKISGVCTEDLEVYFLNYQVDSWRAGVFPYMRLSRIEIGLLVHVDFTNHSVYGATFRRVIRTVPRVSMLLVCDMTSFSSLYPISGAVSSSLSSSDPAVFLRVVVKEGMEPSCSILAAER